MSTNNKIILTHRDREHNGPVIVASLQGGMDIEEVAEKDPNALSTVPVDIIEGIQDKHVELVYIYSFFSC